MADNLIFLHHRVIQAAKWQINQFQICGKSSPLRVGHVIWRMLSGYKDIVCPTDFIITPKSTTSKHRVCKVN